jgi:predicted TIM-barrel fold metal-dependent hydrolase
MALPGLDRSMRELASGHTDHAIISSPNSDIQRLPRDELVALIRSSNDDMLEITRQHPARYALFASLPMPQIDACLQEIERVHGRPGVRGFLLITNYVNKWLGDAQFAPVLDELNRRRAAVFVHPNAADCCRGLLPGVPDAIVEFETDTARTIASLIFNGAAERYSDIRFIFSHAGGTMPNLIERFEAVPKMNPAVLKAIPKGVESYLRSFYYDTAQAANDMALGSLLKLVPASHVLFGTDFPYRGTQEQVAQLRAMRLGSDAMAGILAKNASTLLHEGAVG